MTTVYDRPTLDALQKRIAADLSAMPAVLREPITRSWAGSAHGLHGHLDWIGRQTNPLTCDDEILPHWAALYSVDRLLATYAEGPALAKGNPGTTMLLDTVMRGQNGLDYKVTTPATVDTDTAQVYIRCQTAGTAGNMIAGQTLTLIDPVPGFESTLTVVDQGIKGGNEEETIDAWRTRVVDEWQTITTDGARGGRTRDYKFWAQSAHPSVTAALVYPHALGPGTVLVYPICDGLQDRLPTQPIIDAVKLYLMGTAPEYSGNAPATADVSVARATPVKVNITLTLNTGYDTEVNRAAIVSAVREAIMKENSEGSVFLLAELDAAISTVTTQYVRRAPTDDITAKQGEIITLNTINWVTA